MPPAGLIRQRQQRRDLAILARAMITNYPELYKIYAEKTFTYNGIKQGNRNRCFMRLMLLTG